MIDKEFVCLGVVLKVMNAGKSAEESGFLGVVRESWGWVLYVFMWLVVECGKFNGYGGGLGMIDWEFVH